jgi:uncharacterized membrane protein YraQ (UPF0718 family)
VRFFLNDLMIVALKSEQGLSRLWLYVVVGVLASEGLRYTSWVKVVQRACSARPMLAVVGATALGAVSPLCTYGTVPVVAELVVARVGVAPVVAFLSSSSLMNPQLFVLTWGGIYPGMAMVRLGAVLAFGSLLGLALIPVPARWLVRPALLADDASVNPARATRLFTWQDFAKRSCRTLLFVGKYLLIGIVAGAAIEVFVPSRWFLRGASPGHLTGVLIATAISIPLSACGGGAIPLVRSFMTQGMSRGSVLAFFIAGPASRPSPIMALAAIVRPAALVGYLLLLLAFSVAAGLAYG